MKKYLTLIFLAVFLVSCGSSKKSSYKPRNVVGNKTSSIKANKREETKTYEINTTPKSKNALEGIIDHAMTFEGTRYKYGGTTKSGMDCSGLVYTAFKTEDITLPRRSRDMATKGVLVSLKDAEEGDLVFFATGSNKNTISHVGLVVEAKRGDIRFVHSTTRAGVIVSSLDEKYWKNAFVQVRRLL